MHFFRAGECEYFLEKNKLKAILMKIIRHLVKTFTFTIRKINRIFRIYRFS
jgi:hypothetical protein